MSDAFIAVDPGSKGAVCIYVPSLSKTLFIDLTETNVEIVSKLKYYQFTYNIIMCMIEDVHSIHGTSAKSNFTFGFNLGNITGIMEALGIPIDKVTPKVWQKEFGITPASKTIKKDVATKCTQLYPSCDIFGKRGGIIDGRSDALGIATYCYHKYKR